MPEAALCRGKAADRTALSPYHHALRRLVDETEAAFGGYLLVDCHSMPRRQVRRRLGRRGYRAGDCYGASCAPRIVEAARAFLAERNYAMALTRLCRRFTTGHYGNPRRGRHAVQIEINRSLYMDERSYARKPGFERLTADMTGLVAHLGRYAEYLAGPTRAAAE